MNLSHDVYDIGDKVLVKQPQGRFPQDYDYLGITAYRLKPGFEVSPKYVGRVGEVVDRYIKGTIYTVKIRFSKNETVEISGIALEKLENL